MGTYTEQDCLDRISLMKTWREDAGTALGDKGVNADASTLLADMPALISSISEAPYARFDSRQYTAHLSDLQNNQYPVVSILSNTRWSAVVNNATVVPSSGTGDASVTVQVATSGVASLCYNYVMRVKANDADDSETAVMIRLP